MSSSATPSNRLDRLLPLLRSEPGNSSLHRECLDLAMRGGEYSRALELVDARLSRHPAEPESLFARTNALIGLGRFDEALTLLKSLEAQNVAPLPVLQNLAMVHQGLRRYESVIGYTDRLLAAGEKTAAVLQLAIHAHHHLAKVDEALKLAEEHADVVASNGALAGTCALLYVDANDSAKAAKLAKIAFAANPDSIDANIVLGTLAAADLAVEPASRHFSRVTELAPNNGRAWLGLGLLATLQQDFTRARALLARATQQMPEHLGSWHALAWAHLFSGDNAGAERIFAHALELDPTFAESHGAMAAMHAMKGDRAAAEREIDVADRLDRTGMSSHFARAVLVGQEQGGEAGRDALLKSIAKLSSRFNGRPAEVLRQLASGAVKKP